MPSAVERVFAVQELFEKIFDSYLDSCGDEADDKLTVLALQRVSKTFRDSISGSTHLLRQMHNGPLNIDKEAQSIAGALKVRLATKQFGLEHVETHIEDPDARTRTRTSTAAQTHTNVHTVTPPLLSFHATWHHLKLPCQPGTWRDLKLFPRAVPVIVTIPNWRRGPKGGDGYGGDRMYFKPEATLGTLVDRMADDWTCWEDHCIKTERFKLFPITKE